MGTEEENPEEGAGGLSTAEIGDGAEDTCGRADDAGLSANDSRGREGSGIRFGRRGQQSENGYFSQLMKLAEAMSPCSVGVFRARAIGCIPAESARDLFRNKLGRVNKWITDCKSVAVSDGVLRFIPDAPKPEPAPKTGQKLFDQLVVDGQLTTEQAVTFWTAKTWRTYQTELVSIGWCTRNKDGTLVWCGPNDATWQAFHLWRRDKKRKSE